MRLFERPGSVEGRVREGPSSIDRYGSIEAPGSVEGHGFVEGHWSVEAHAFGAYVSVQGPGSVEGQTAHQSQARSACAPEARRHDVEVLAEQINGATVALTRTTNRRDRRAASTDRQCR
jgi:hypothetical protein